MINGVAQFLAQLYLLVRGTCHVGLLMSIAYASSLASALFIYQVPFEPVDLPAMWSGLFSLLLILHVDIVTTKKLVDGLAEAAVDGLTRLGEVFK